MYFRNMSPLMSVACVALGALALFLLLGGGLGLLGGWP